MRIRIIEEGIINLYQEQEMRCPTHFSIGQEAVASGVCANLCLDDNVISAHRSHAHYLGKRGSIEKLFNEIHGLSSWCSGGKGGSMHLIDQSVGFFGSVPIVAGSL